MDSLGLNEKIAAAIDKIIEKRLSTEAYDKTVEGKVVSIVDSSAGEYKVSINSMIYDAYSLNVAITYEVDDEVYIKIPQNNMSFRKYIEGKRPKQVEAPKIEKYIEGSPKFQFKNLEDTAIGLISNTETLQEIVLWEKDSDNNKIEILDNNLKNNFSDIFNYLVMYQNEFDYLKFSVKISTKILNATISEKSNYGMKFYFSSNNEDLKDKTIVLDVLTFNFAPWDYLNGYIEQVMRFSKDEFENYNLEKITIFQEFLFDDIVPNSENILFKDVLICFERKLIPEDEEEEEEAQYTIQLESNDRWLDSATLDGGDEAIINEIFYNPEHVIIQANLYDKKNKNISNEEAYTFFWNEEAIPTTGSVTKNNNKYGGASWRKINQIHNIFIEDENGEQVDKWDSYTKELRQIKTKYIKDSEAQKTAIKELNDKYGIKPNNLQMKIKESKGRNCKLAVVKNEKVVATKEFEIWHDINLKDFDVQVKVEEQDYNRVRLSLYTPENEKIVAFWYVKMYEDGKLEETERSYYDFDEYESEISFRCPYDYLTYEAYVYKAKNQEYIKKISGKWQLT